MEQFIFSQEELTKELNKGREIYLEALLKEGVLTKEKVDEMSGYSIVLAGKTVLGSVWDKFFNKKPTARYFVVKVLEQWETKDE